MRKALDRLKQSSILRDLEPPFSPTVVFKATRELVGAHMLPTLMGLKYCGNSKSDGKGGRVTKTSLSSLTWLDEVPGVHGAGFTLHSSVCKVFAKGVLP